MIVYGEPHCITFFQLLELWRWAGADKKQRKREFDQHCDTCPACIEFAKTKPGQYTALDADYELEAEMIPLE